MKPGVSPGKTKGGNFMTIKEAKFEAQQQSRKNPDSTFYVLKKKGKGATFTRIEWVFWQRFYDGWGPVCTFRNGEEKA